jgi:sec-independent protein translocase protein TatA
MNLGAPEIIGLLVVALILFGANRLPEIGKGLGKGIREFKKASKELTGELESSFKDEPVTTPSKQKTEA